MSDSPQERCGLLNRHTSFLPPGKTASKTRERCAFWRGGAEGGRTPDLLIANEALSQLSYGPAKMPPHAVIASAGIYGPESRESRIGRGRPPAPPPLCVDAGAASRLSSMRLPATRRPGHSG